jgi:hypothetical protein
VDTGVFIPSDPPFERIASHHNVEAFKCEETSVQEMFRLRALADEQLDRSRTYVLAGFDGDSGQPCIGGFYALMAGFMGTSDAPAEAFSPLTDLPFRLPIIYVDLLARDERFSGQGLGKILVVDALTRSVSVSDNIGASGIFLTSLNVRSHRLYLSFGFHDFDPHRETHRRMFLPMHSARAIVSV